MPSDAEADAVASRSSGVLRGAPGRVAGVADRRTARTRAGRDSSAFSTATTATIAGSAGRIDRRLAEDLVEQGEDEHADRAADAS